MAVWWCCYTYCVCMTRIKNKSKPWQFRMIRLCWFGFFILLFIVWRVSEVIGLNIQCGYVILLIEMGPSCRPTLNWDVSQIIWKNMTNYYLLYSGLGWQNPHWFGLDTGRKCYSLICRFSEIGRAQIKKCWPERDKPLSRRSTCASLKSVTVIAEMHRRSCQHTQTQSACI